MTEQTKLSEKRFSIIVGKEVQEALSATAKQYKISQSEVIGILHANADMEALAPKFKAKREAKVNGRAGKSSVMQKLSKLSADQLQKLLASVETKP